MSVTNKVKNSFKQGSLLGKGFFIFLLIIVLMIPMGMVNDLMQERQYRSQEVANEIHQQWSGQQALIGPLMTVKYRHYYGRDGKFYTKQFHLAPEKVIMDVSLEPEERYRGLFKTVVYLAKGQVRGRYDLSEIQKILKEDVNVESIYVSVGLSDKRGINDEIILTANSTKHTMKSIKDTTLFGSGVEVQLDQAILKRLQKDQALDFSFNVNFKGSSRFSSLPIAGETTININSAWQSPSFYGAFLPDQREITDSGFRSRWTVLDMNHSLPRVWKDAEISLNHYLTDSVRSRSHAISKYSDNTFSTGSDLLGVQLIVPAGAYQQSERSAKYAFLFIVLTFVAFFIAETLTANRLHPFQYLLIGSSLVMFYTLLLAFSEHFGFGLAYLISSLSVSLLVTNYSRAVLNSQRLAKFIFGLLSGLYAYLYVILQLESYALLMGSIGLFVILSMVMYFTRNIDWYKTANPESNQLVMS